MILILGMVKIVKGLIAGNLLEKLRIFFVLLQRFLSKNRLFSIANR